MEEKKLVQIHRPRLLPVLTASPQYLFPLPNIRYVYILAHSKVRSHEIHKIMNLMTPDLALRSFFCLLIIISDSFFILSKLFIKTRLKHGRSLVSVHEGAKQMIIQFMWGGG